MPNFCVQVFQQVPENQQDSNDVKTTKVDSGLKPTSAKNINHQVKASSSEAVHATAVKAAIQDSSQVNLTSAYTLFTVPYRCTLNRDSLRAEQRKIVLEIDTLPKGLELVVSEKLKNNTIPPILKPRVSIFNHHLLVPEKFEPKVKISTHQNWVVLVVLLMLFLIGILRVFYQKKFSLFINAFISKRFSNQIIREENALSQGTSIVLTSVFFIAISLFLYSVSNYFYKGLNRYSELQGYIMVLLACVGFYFLKYFLNKIGGYIFKVFKEIDEYIFNQFLVLQILGLALTLWCILLNFSTDINKELIIYLGFGTLALGFIIRMIKSFGIVNMNTYSPVYIFLYLCTLEILPLIIIVKLIIR